MTERNMQGIHGAIGKVLENKIQEALPHITKNPDGSNLPDFSWENIHLEAKNGYKKWGPKPHSSQFNNLLVKPDFYVLGYHDFANSMNLTKQGNYFTWLKTLEKEMGFKEIVFCSSDVVENIFDLMVPKTQQEVHNYGRIRPSFMKGIFNEKSFKIHGVEYSGSDLAGKNYYIENPKQINEFGCDVGFIIKHEDTYKLNNLFSKTNIRI